MSDYLFSPFQLATRIQNRRALHVRQRKHDVRYKRQIMAG
jgi:hypothetical protein